MLPWMGRTTAFASLVSLLSLGASGQTVSLVFEVASVRVNQTGIRQRGSMEFLKGGERFSATNISLGPLILTAYDVTERQISVTGSFPADRYDIAAKAAHPVNPNEMRRMLQQLLINRFALVVHRETKEVPVYALVISKGRAKLHPSEESERDATPRTPASAGGTEPQSGHLIFRNESMADLAWALSRMAGIGDRVVVDQTGLTGKYDFELTFARDGALSADPSIFSALQEQLGLRLEAKKAPVEFLVIDHVEKLSGN